MRRTFLVSGAGSGIGRAVAQRLAASGARLVLLGRDRHLLEETRGSLGAEAPHAIVKADVRRAAEIREGLAATDLEDGLAGVFANAGIGGPNSYGEDDRWHDIIETNLTGAYYTVMETIPYLRRCATRTRHIVINSSLLSKIGAPGHTAYCASKAGLLGLTRALAVELARDRILVNAICAGWVDTKLAREGLSQIAARAGADANVVMEKLLADVPLGKMSTLDEVADLVAYLVSPGQRSITGAALDINNGAYMTS